MTLYVVNADIDYAVDYGHDTDRWVLPIAFDAFEDAVDYMANFDIREVFDVGDLLVTTDMLAKDHRSRRVEVGPHYCIYLHIQELALHRKEDD